MVEPCFFPLSCQNVEVKFLHSNWSGAGHGSVASECPRGAGVRGPCRRTAYLVRTGACRREALRTPCLKIVSKLPPHFTTVSETRNTIVQESGCESAGKQVSTVRIVMPGDTCSTTRSCTSSSRMLGSGYDNTHPDLGVLCIIHVFIVYLYYSVLFSQ